MKKVLLGLAIGLAAWACISFLLSTTGLYRIDLEARAPVPVSVYYMVYLGESIPVLIGGVVAGSISGKPGIVSGAVFGICQGLILWVLWCGGSRLDDWASFREVFALMYALPGVLGGYLGQRLARFRRPPRVNTDQETAKGTRG